MMVGCVDALAVSTVSVDTAAVTPVVFVEAATGTIGVVSVEAATGTTGAGAGFSVEAATGTTGA